MKCKHCNTEWTANDNKIWFFCPFCQAPLIVVQERIHTLKEALQYVVSLYGVEILNDKQNILQFVTYILPENKRECNFVNMAYTSGIVKMLLRSRNSDKNQQQTLFKHAVGQLQETFGVSEEWATYIIDCLAVSIGMAECPQNSIVQKRLKAENGDQEAQYELAIEFFQKENIEKYLYWIKKAIDSGSSQAEYHYAKFLFSTEKSNGIEHMVKCMRAGNIDALCFLARNINIGDPYFNIVKDAVEKTNIENLHSSQQLIDLSVYFEKYFDSNEAIVLAEKAYVLDPLLAWNRYTKLLKKRATSKDLIVVDKVYREMAEKGNLEAILSLAKSIEAKGESSDKVNVALYWYKMAAESGNLEAQLYLARTFETGKHVKKDLNEAIKWYEAAAANQSKEAYEKISFKSPSCIRKMLSLLFEDGSTLECKVEGYLFYDGKDYLVVVDLDSQEEVPLLYRETDDMGNYEVETIDELEGQNVLSAFRRQKQ